MKCSKCLFSEKVINTDDAKVCKLNPPIPIGVPQMNQITGDTVMGIQPTNVLVSQGDYDNGGCSHYSEAPSKIKLV